MKAEDLKEAFRHVEDSYLELVESEKRKRRPSRIIRYLLVACISLCLILPAGAMASNWFGLQNLLLRESTTENDTTELTESAEFLPAEEAGDGEEMGVPESTQETVDFSGTDQIGLSGYFNSPEMKALAEWQEFLAGYDTDGSLLAAVGNQPTGLEDRYALYLVYTREMADKLDEITAKYDLKLHTELNVVSPEELAWCVEGEFLTEECLSYYGYIYEDGSFQFDGDVRLTGKQSTGFQFRRVVKGTFDEVVLNIGDASEYQEVPYRTSGGEMVILALGPNKALIYGDFERCFLSVNVLGGTENGITEEDLKAMADGIDFSMLKEGEI